MTRPIKFRAWWKPKGKRKGYMIPVSRLIICDDRSKGWYWQAQVAFDKEPPQTIGGITTDLMQFTGLTDKNGKEIYEGDIVRYTQAGHRKGEPRIVARIGFESGTFCFDDLGLPFMDSVSTHRKTGEKLIEVIGNIHENAELLK